jgi:hypothetical protein
VRIIGFFVTPGLDLAILFQNPAQYLPIDA